MGDFAKSLRLSKMAALPRTYSKFLRSFSTTSVARMSGEGHGGGWQFWKKAFFLGAIPAVVLANVNAFFLGEGEEEMPSSRPTTTSASGPRNSPGEMATTLCSTTPT